LLDLVFQPDCVALPGRSHVVGDNYLGVVTTTILAG
jgi:hypothetical protein